jgi:predicted transcriptional regulator
MRKLTLVDRMVLESIHKSDKNIASIQIDTTLPIAIVNSVIENLLTQGLILINKNSYSVNDNMSEDLVSYLKNQRELFVQVKALICECVHERNPEISFYKAYLAPDDEKILATLFYNIESFIKNLNKNKKPTKDETFIFWGKENYAKAIHSYIS